jgi:hypothetical protein
VPTARLQPSGGLYATGGAFVIPDRTPMLGVAFGLGGLADVDLEVHDRLAVCLEPGTDGCVAESIATPTAGFRIGLPERFYGRWQPALALGFRAPIGDREIDVAGDPSRFRAARLYAVASSQLGPVELHAGADVWDAEVIDSAGTRQLHDEPLRRRVRPLAGLVWNPSIYPRTHLLVDGSWAPVFDGDEVTLRWLMSWGVRYQALSWGSIELDVRHREGGDLGDSEVTIRLNGAWDLAAAFR